MTSLNDVISQKMDMVWKNFLQNIYLIIFNNFNHDKLGVKTANK